MSDFDATKKQTSILETLLQIAVFSFFLLFASLIEQALIPYTTFRADTAAQVEIPIICLTFGLRVLGAYLAGFKSIIFFAPAALVLDATSQTILGLHFENSLVMLILLTAAPVIFMLFDWASPIPHIEMLNTPSGWRILASGSIMIAMVETLATHILAGTHPYTTPPSTDLVVFFGSKMLGLAVVLAVMLAAKRIMRSPKDAN